MKPIKIKVDCTKEHLEKAKWCDIDANKHTSSISNNIGSNCWIAVAVQDILPNAYVSPSTITNLQSTWVINLPENAKSQIRLFDYCKTIERREQLNPFSFDIEIDEQTLDIILSQNGFGTYENFAEIINSQPNLELVTV